MRIKANVKKIEEAQSYRKARDECSSDVLSKIPEVSIQNQCEEYEILNSEIMQTCFANVANYAYTECISLLEFMSLRKKVLHG